MTNFAVSRWYRLPWVLPIATLVLMGCGGAGVSNPNFPTLGSVLPLPMVQTPITAVATLLEESPSQQISAQGQVTQVAPLLSGGLYELTDETGSLWVMTTEVLPPLDSTLRVQGQLQQESIPVEGVEFGGVYLVESDRWAVE